MKEKKRKYYLQFTILSLSLSSKKNLHEGNILYFGLEVCKKNWYEKKSGSEFYRGVKTLGSCFRST